MCCNRGTVSGTKSTCAVVPWIAGWAASSLCDQDHTFSSLLVVVMLQGGSCNMLMRDSFHLTDIWHVFNLSCLYV
jgi:hypothetical protein